MTNLILEQIIVEVKKKKKTHTHGDNNLMKLICVEPLLAIAVAKYNTTTTTKYQLPAFLSTSLHCAVIIHHTSDILGGSQYSLFWRLCIVEYYCPIYIWQVRTLTNLDFSRFSILAGEERKKEPAAGCSFLISSPSARNEAKNLSIWGLHHWNVIW